MCRWAGRDAGEGAGAQAAGRDGDGQSRPRGLLGSASVAAQLLDEPVLVDALSLVWLRCIAVTVKEPAPLPRKVAAEKLFEALRAQGVRIEILASSKRDGDTWIVKIHDRPAACPVSEGEVVAAGADAGADVGAGADAPVADHDAVLADVLSSIRELSPSERRAEKADPPRGVNGADRTLVHYAAN